LSGCRKLAGSKNDWRIRVGDYRVIYEIADEIRVVRINLKKAVETTKYRNTRNNRLITTLGRSPAGGTLVAL